MLTVNRRAAGAMLRAVVSLGRKVHLYANDVHPSREHDLKAFQEVTGGGYAPVELAADDWVVREDGKLCVATRPPVKWAFTSGVGNIFGYYVTDAGGALLWAERLAPAPFLAANPGDKLRIALAFDLGPRT